MAESQWKILVDYLKQDQKEQLEVKRRRRQVRNLPEIESQNSQSLSQQKPQRSQTLQITNGPVKQQVQTSLKTSRGSNKSHFLTSSTIQ